jgi:hypothetical protein
MALASALQKSSGLFYWGYHSNLLHYEMTLANASYRTLQQQLFL